MEGITNKLQRSPDEKESGGELENDQSIKSVDLYNYEPQDKELYLKYEGNNNYTPIFEKEGEVETYATSWGWGIFKQNNKFYYSTCIQEQGMDNKAWLIPENIAMRIVQNMKLQSEETELDRLVESLGGPNTLDILKEIAKKIS